MTMGRPIPTTAPAETPVTLAEAKTHLRVDGPEEDDLISGYIRTAVRHLDGWSGILGRCMVTQTWTVGLRAWSSRIRLPFPDVSGVVITYRDTSDVEQTVSTSLYEVIEDARGGVVEFRSAWTRPSVNDDRAEPISLAITAGYGDASAVPDDLKHAILLLVGHYSGNRQAVSEDRLTTVPLGVESLTAPYRYSVI